MSGETRPRVQPPSNLIAEITKRSLLDLVPGLTELAMEHGEIRAFGARTEVCAQGTPADSLWIAIDGGMRIVQRTGAAQGDRIVGYVNQGRSIALRQVLSRGVYPYSIHTERPSRLLRVPAERALPLIERDADLRHYLELITSSSGARSLRSQLQERGVSAADLRAVFACFEREARTVLPGQSLLVGDAQGVFLVQDGQLQLFGKDRDGAVAGGEGAPEAAFEGRLLGEGAWFGGESLAAPYVCTYRARAERRTVVNFAEARALARAAERLGLTDFFFSDPWVYAGQRDEKTRVLLRPAAVGSGGLTDADRARIREEYLELPAPEDLFIVDQATHSAYAAAINVARLLRREVSLSSLELALKRVPRLTPLRFAQAMEPFGFCVRVQQAAGPASLEFLSRGLKPGRACVLPYGDRYLVFLGLGADGAVLALDPTTGYRRLDRPRFAQDWDGQYLELDADVAPELPAPDDAQTKQDPARATQLALRRYVTRMILRQKRLLLNTLAITLTGLLLGLAPPFLSQKILDEVLTLRDPAMLYACVAGLALCVLASIAVSYLRQANLAEFARQLDARLSSFFYRYTLALGSAQFRGQRAGELLARMGELSQIRSFLAGNAIQTAMDLASVGVYAAVLGFYSPWILGIAVLLGLLIGLTRVLTRRHFATLQRRAFDHDADANSLVAEQISAINAIKASGAETVSRRRWEAAMIAGSRTTRDIQVQSSSMQAIIGALSSVARVGAIWLAADQVLKGTLSPGQILAVSMYFDRLVGPLGNLASLISSLEEIKLSLQKVGEILTTPLEQPPERAASAHSLQLRGKIKVDAVSFRYASDTPWVLNDVSFTIYPRQIVAIVGRSGCGKTTLANLLAGSIKPTSGRVFFDDFDQSFLSSQNLRSQIGVINQNSELFAGSITENIAFADDAPLETQVERAANDSHASEFVDGLPTRYQHFLGEGGMGLSGGQKQRLSIARTLYREPRVLIMDEATSALDAESERAIVDKMATILEGKTAIVIAHRLSTIRSAHRILVMKEGRIVEEGTHNELLQANGHYAELFESQANASDA